jgi:hypothetical protein
MWLWLAMKTEGPYLRDVAVASNENRGAILTHFGLAMRRNRGAGM